MYTAATQWLERSLDDSSNRRLTIAEAFLTCEAILETLNQITHHLVIYPQVMERHINEELPFIATENILMAGIKKGIDRQILHEKIREHSQAASFKIKVQGGRNDLLERIANDESIPLSHSELLEILNIKAFTGRAAEQVKEFLEKEVFPQIEK